MTEFMMKEKGTEGRIFRTVFAALSFILLVLSLVLVFGKAVSGKEKMETARLEQYYKELEEQVVVEMRGYLEERGFANSGVMLTRIVDAGGNREYTLHIHNNKFDHMTEEELGSENQLIIAELMKAAEQISNVGDYCSFKQEFIITR